LDVTAKMIQLRALAWTWKDIDPVCIPSQAEMGRGDRHLAQSNFRANCKTLVNERKRNMSTDRWAKPKKPFRS